MSAVQRSPTQETLSPRWLVTCTELNARCSCYVVDDVPKASCRRVARDAPEYVDDESIWPDIMRPKKAGDSVVVAARIGKGGHNQERGDDKHELEVHNCWWFIVMRREVQVDVGRCGWGWPS